MEYHLLGPVEARHQGDALRIGGPRQRTVLATLALNLGQVVPVRSLVEAVWDGAPPATAHRQILTAVSGLRRSLGTAIETRHAGYLLHARPDDVDIHRFERLVAEARRLDEGSLHAAAARLREALALWRGPALGGVRGMAAEVARLEERRLSVLELCLEAELATGAHADRVAELFALVRAHPLRERFRALLMRALHQLGRQAEALEVYRSGRTQLVEELGIEPGQELARLHAMILAGGDERIPVAAGPLRASDRVTEQQVPGPAWYRDPPVPVPPAFFGVTLNSTRGEMPGFRVSAVRLWDCACRWSNIQPRKDVFDWQRLDRFVARAQSARLPVLYTMGMPAGWASPDARRAPYTNDSRAAPPRDLADWDAYVHATVTRYCGRIEAYELWDYANSPMSYNGSADTLAEMVRRAAQIIRSVDPAAFIVSPSFGDLWEPSGREQLHRYALAGTFEPCDAVAVKLHQRDTLDPPEQMIELTDLINRTLHKAGVQRALWATGPSHDIVHAPRPDQATAGAHAVRHFLAGIYARCARMYFYNWGGRKIPLVLQADGGPPTQAARFVERLQHWLDGACVRSGSHGSDDNLPPNVWQIRLVAPTAPEGGPPGRSPGDAVIRWTDTGEATMPVEPGMARIEHLDGTVEVLDSAGPMVITELPALIHYHPGSEPSAGG
ncbi:BTAD domain-containing putative transcriptional regulator [Actinopolymorpha sp. B11F2]|uniref:AfsR/SARP family transcriptional regulator n=1 Tax=Actinopolymorpha sp. B11F2 TaxID=3160862 RepID=UPI0032E372F7